VPWKIKKPSATWESRRYATYTVLVSIVLDNPNHTLCENYTNCTANNRTIGNAMLLYTRATYIVRKKLITF